MDQETLSKFASALADDYASANKVMQREEEFQKQALDWKNTLNSVMNWAEENPVMAGVTGGAGLGMLGGAASSMWQGVNPSDDGEYRDSWWRRALRTGALGGALGGMAGGLYHTMPALQEAFSKWNSPAAEGPTPDPQKAVLQNDPASGEPLGTIRDVQQPSDDYRTGKRWDEMTAGDATLGSAYELVKKVNPWNYETAEDWWFDPELWAARGFRFDPEFTTIHADLVNTGRRNFDQAYAIARQNDPLNFPELTPEASANVSHILDYQAKRQLLKDPRFSSKAYGGPSWLSGIPFSNYIAATMDRIGGGGIDSEDLDAATKSLKGSLLPPLREADITPDSLYPGSDLPVDPTTGLPISSVTGQPMRYSKQEEYDRMIADLIRKMFTSSRRLGQTNIGSIMDEVK